MGLKFQKDMHLASEQIYPPPAGSKNLTKVQERLLKKLGKNAFPFTFKFPQNTPASVTLQPGPEDAGRPCGVEYLLKAFVGESENDMSHKRSSVALSVRKIQYAPSKSGRQPCTLVKKDFMMSPGELELEATLDKQVIPIRRFPHFRFQFLPFKAVPSRRKNRSQHFHSEQQ